MNILPTKTCFPYTIIKLEVYYLDKIVVNIYHKLSVQKENQKDMFIYLSAWLYVSFMNFSIGIFF